jgi:dsRNA-specific ribonuclease
VAQSLPWLDDFVMAGSPPSDPAAAWVQAATSVWEPLSVTSRDPVAVLNEWAQHHQVREPKYEFQNTSLADHLPNHLCTVQLAGKIYTTVVGESKKTAAKKRAAEGMLKMLQGRQPDGVAPAAATQARGYATAAATAAPPNLADGVRHRLGQLLLSNTPPTRNPVTILNEWSQANGVPSPDYSFDNVGTQAHCPQFRCTVTVAGYRSISCAETYSSKLEAKHAAAGLFVKRHHLGDA